MGKRYWTMLLLALCAGAAFAAGPGAVRKQIESSLLVKGTIDITADGTVAGYALEGSDGMSAGIKNMVARVVPHWRFEPVVLSPGATSARATMSLRFVAKKLDDDNFSIAIASAHFNNDRPGEALSSRRRMGPPKYPVDAARSGVSGTVYTVLKIGRDGRVEEAIAEQVNLRLVADENSMQRWRNVLAKATLQATRGWLFEPPTRGAEVDAPYWSARVPVDFVAPGADVPNEGKWNAYVPGPRAVIPWQADEPDTGADAVAANGVYMLDGGPRLLTALNPP